MYCAILISIGILFTGVVVSAALQLPTAVGGIMLLATSIWAGFDARKIEFKKYKTSLGSTVYGGGGVFAAVLLLWIIFFPWYLFSRDKILSGQAKLKDKYEGETLKEGEMMEEKEYQSITREDAIAVLKSKRKKSKFWYVIGVITVGLIFFCLFFRVVTFSNDFTVIAKKHPTFSNTFVDLDNFIKRCNEATEEYNKDRFNLNRNSLETYLRSHAIDPALHEELYEKGLIGAKGEDSEDSKLKQKDKASVSEPVATASSNSEATTDSKPQNRKNPNSAETTANLPRLVDLGADKSIPCKIMAPILKELKTEYQGKFQVVFIDVWENPDEAKKYKINIIPTQIFYDASGKELYRHEGFYSKEDILNKWKEFGI
ncbi:MAG: thioredoxin family protein [Planctomycetota bacterium]|nr:thioredoxin family protein [Planctomycetota bacterium]